VVKSKLELYLNFKTRYETFVATDLFGLKSTSEPFRLVPIVIGIGTSASPADRLEVKAKQNCQSTTQS